MARTTVTPVKRDAVLNYSASKTGALFHKSDTFVRVMLGPVGSGKSSATWVELFRRACEEHPDEHGVRSSRHLVVRDTYPQLKATTIKDFESWFGKLGTIVYDSPIRGHVGLDLPDGTRLDWNLWFLPLDGGEKSLDILRGLAISGAYVNEGHSVDETVYATIINRIGRYRPAGVDAKWRGMIVDSNFGYSGCYLHKKHTTADPDWEFFVQPPAATYDKVRKEYVLNPHAENLANLDRGYYQRQLKLPLKVVRQMLANQWSPRTTGKPVWPEFSTVDHTRNENPRYDPGLPVLIGHDFGLHSASVFGQLSRDGALVVLSEVWNDDTGLEQYIESQLVPHIRENYPTAQMILCGDPAGLGRSQHTQLDSFAILAAAGIKAVPAVTNDFTLRVQAVEKFLSRRNGFIMYTPKCERLLAALEGAYGYKRNYGGSSDYHQFVDKNNVHSHIADALQYLALFARNGDAYNITYNSLLRKSLAKRAKASKAGNSKRNAVTG